MKRVVVDSAAKNKLRFHVQAVESFERSATPRINKRQPAPPNRLLRSRETCNAVRDLFWIVHGVHNFRYISTAAINVAPKKSKSTAAKIRI